METETITGSLIVTKSPTGTIKVENQLTNTLPVSDVVLILTAEAHRLLHQYTMAPPITPAEASLHK